MGTDVGRLIDEIGRLPHWRSVPCSSCGGLLRVHALQIDARCAPCGSSVKCRAFGGVGTELEDVIDAVLQWAGAGESFEAVMRRRGEIVGDWDGE